MADKIIHEVRIVETDDGYRIEIKGDKEQLKKMGFGKGGFPFGFGPGGMGRGRGPFGHHGQGHQHGFGWWGRHQGGHPWGHGGHGPWWMEDDEDDEGDQEQGRRETGSAERA